MNRMGRPVEYCDGLSQVNAQNLVVNPPWCAA